jgi:5'-nucleotidase
VILTRDKTLVRGDILVDDKPTIAGLATPLWRHILFDQPYNRHFPTLRLNWFTWREILHVPPFRIAYESGSIVPV